MWKLEDSSVHTLKMETAKKDFKYENEKYLHLHKWKCIDIWCWCFHMHLAFTKQQTHHGWIYSTQVGIFFLPLRRSFRLLVPGHNCDAINFCHNPVWLDDEWPKQISPLLLVPFFSMIYWKWGHSVFWKQKSRMPVQLASDWSCRPEHWVSVCDTVCTCSHLINGLFLHCGNSWTLKHII